MEEEEGGRKRESEGDVTSEEWSRDACGWLCGHVGAKKRG